MDYDECGPAPTGLEYKIASLPAIVRKGWAPDPAALLWEGIVTVTGVPLPGGVSYSPGAIGRAAAKRVPKITVGRSWARRGGAVRSLVELPPGDPRLPDTLPDGSPLPPTAGAVWARVAFLDTDDGRAALAAAHTDPGLWVLAFASRGERVRGGVREITELDLFNLWPRSLPDPDDGRPGPEVKAAGPRVEVKGSTSALSAVRRSRLFSPVACALCTRPAAGTSGGPLPPGRKIICADCMGALDDLAVDAGVVTAEQLAEAAAVAAEPELTSEEHFLAALDGELEFEMGPDGTLRPVRDGDERDGTAWRRNRGPGIGRC